MTNTDWMTETERKLYAELRAGAERDVQAERQAHRDTGTRPHIFDNHEDAARKLLEHWIAEGRAAQIIDAYVRQRSKPRTWPT